MPLQCVVLRCVVCNKTNCNHENGGALKAILTCLEHLYFPLFKLNAINDQVSH